MENVWFIAAPEEIALEGQPTLAENEVPLSQDIHLQQARGTQPL